MSQITSDFEGAMIDAFAPLKGLVAVLQADPGVEGRLMFSVGSLLGAAIEKAERELDAFAEQHLDSLEGGRPKDCLGRSA